MNDKTHTLSEDSDAMASAARAETTDRIASGAHNGIDAVSEAAHPTIERAAAGAHKAVESADALANHAAEALDRAGAKGQELAAAGSRYLRAHPKVTLGLAVTAGYILSRLLASR